MKRILKAFTRELLTVVFFIIFASNICVAENTIVARVGEDIITSNDLERRYAAHINTNDLLPSESETKAIKLQLIHSLINEKIIIKGAQKSNIVVTDQDIAEEVESIEAQQNMAKGSFYKHHEQYGITEKDLKEQLYVKLAWQRILMDVIFPKHGQNAVSDAELDEFIVQNYPASIKIKGFIYEFNKDDLKNLEKLYKINKKNLCDINILQNVTGIVPEKIDTTLKNIKNNKIQQVVSFAKENSSILTSEKNDKIVALILCEKKPNMNEEEMNKVRAELKNKKIAPYAEHYFKALKKNEIIVINNIEQYAQ
jgi:hypothetical protein